MQNEVHYCVIKTVTRIVNLGIVFFLKQSNINQPVLKLKSISLIS